MSTRLHTVSRLTALLCVLAFALSLTPAAKGADAQSQFAFTIGAYDMIRQRDDSGQAGIEYRMPRRGFWKLKSWFGMLSTSDQAVWGGGGLYYDWEISPRLRLTPSLGAGFYEDGIGIDLGHTLEFRSQIEFSYRFASLARVGVNFGHLSNARLADANPGTEYFNVVYTMPLKRRRPGPPIAATGRVAANDSEE